MPKIPVVDASQAARWDERAREDFAIPSRVLMESAGRGIAHVVGEYLPDVIQEGVLVAAGPGNNGGDGWVAARALAALGVPVVVATPEESKSDDCIANRILTTGEGVDVVGITEPWPAVGVVLDAVLGTGAGEAPRGELGELAVRVSEHPGPIVAVDGPTGLDLSSGEWHGPVSADLTVTFGGPRRGHLLAREHCGIIVVIDIGFPDPEPGWPRLVTDLDVASDVLELLPRMHKGNRGRLLVIGGQSGMGGAAIYAARAALAAGVGLAKIASSPGTCLAAQAGSPDVQVVNTELGPELEEGLREAVSWADAIVIGPGMGRGEIRRELVSTILSESKLPAVVDADALHVWEPIEAMREQTVVTPHPGEFRAAFTDLAEVLEEDRFDAAERAAESCGGVVLLKGVPTVIAGPQGTQVVAAGNPGLATGGSGDLLSGFIGTFLAQGLSPAAAAALGAQLLGRAAELAARETSIRSLRPDHVLEAVDRFWCSLEELEPTSPPILLELEPPSLR